MIILLTLLLSFPVDSWQGDVLEEQLVRGVHFTRFPGARPYSELDVQAADTNLWSPFVNLNAYLDTVAVLRLKPAVGCRFDDFYLHLQPDVKFGKDSLLPNRVFKGLFAADYERVFLKYERTFFQALIGRERFSLGPSPRYNLLLSGTGVPLDWFHYALGTKVIRLSYYVSQLDDLKCKPIEYVNDTTSILIDARRFLIIKRLDFSPSEWLDISFTEAATLGGENYALRPYHFNPLVFLHTYQHNWDKDANIFFHLDARLMLPGRCFYAALLVDDFQLEADPNNEPNHLGFNFGTEFTDLFLDWSYFIIEYTGATRYLFCHFYPYQRYEYCGHPIGPPAGTDFDEIFAKYVYHTEFGYDLYVQVSHLRKGGVAIDSLWPIPEIPRVPGTSFPPDNFLSGIVETSTSIGLGTRKMLGRDFVFDIYVGGIQMKNFEHIIGESRSLISIRLKIDWINLSRK